MMRRAALAFALAVAACGRTADSGRSDDVPPTAPPGTMPTASPTTPAPPVDPVDDPGTPVSTKLSAAQQAELDALNVELATVKSLDATGFAQKYAASFATSLGYDPMTAKGLDVIEASTPLALDADEKAKLGANGFVISERKRYPSFVYGYQTLYTADLPVYVSADSILFAVHRSYGRILSSEERTTLSAALARMLASMRSAVASGAIDGYSADTKKDVEFYLGVASGLLTGVVDTKVPDVEAFVKSAVAATGEEQRFLFGVKRTIDFSQFTPRGHYTLTPDLTNYFRAMMWLGRIDLRILETLPNHSQVFRRRQLEAAYAMRATMNAAALTDWKNIDDTIAAFVGESDNMTLPELDGLLSDLGIASPLDLAKKTDAEIAQAVVTGGYGTQRISSHIMVNGLQGGTMPLSSTFLLLGQRYVIDSHVFSNVVYDRVQGGTQKRMMPDPLDVAFAALKNDHAGVLLAPQLQKYSYASDLASMRVVAEAHPQSFWDANLYHQWLGALRALSDRNTPGLPVVANTEPWGRRILNTQLASWAELRHDTLLYAKQSYSGVPGCEYPDAYVDPYPEVYARLAQLAARGAALPISSAARAYFTNLGTVASRFETMAKAQRTGAPHSAADIAWINTLIFTQGCGGLASFDGWYAKLFFDAIDALEAKPTIADVHTQPADEVGATVGRVLHVGTGSARAMVVTVDSCNGPRAYVGLVSSYFEKTTEQFERLTDEKWSSTLVPTPADVPWMTPIVVR